MAKEKRYVELEVEVEVDEDGSMTDDAWQDITRLDGLHDVCGDLVKRVGMPKVKSRKELT